MQWIAEKALQSVKQGKKIKCLKNVIDVMKQVDEARRQINRYDQLLQHHVEE